MNIGVHVSFWIIALSRYMSSGSFVFIPTPPSFLHSAMVSWQVRVPRNRYVSVQTLVRVCACVSTLGCSFVSNSLWLHGLWPTRLLCPWNFPGKNTGMGCHFFLHWILPTQGSNPSFLELSLKHCITSRWQPITAKYCESPYYVLATRLIKKENKGKRRRNSHSLSTNSVPDIGEGVMLAHLVLTIPYEVRITVCVTYTQFQVKNKLSKISPLPNSHSCKIRTYN